MKKQYLLFVFTILFLAFSSRSFAQLVAGNGFLQGKYLEIGEQTNGALGAANPPAGYHIFCSGCWPTYGTPGTAIAEVYDYGHDGWAVGAPPFMGDYTLPGSPFEGWTLQMNGARVQNYQAGGGGTSTSGAIALTGSGLTTYTNSGGQVKVNWAGTFTSGGNIMNVVMETRVDTLASAVVMTCKMYNTTGTPIPGVYIWRSCDPDNDEQYPGGGFFTNNVINKQNDVDHRVEVTATGTSSTLPTLTLCTKDCRAVAVIYGSWGLTVTQDLGAVWSQTYGGGGAFYNVGVNHPGDIGIGLVFNVGTIAAFDSAVVAYSYVFNGVNGIDSAFMEPSIQVNNGPIVGPIGPAPSIVIDTYNACLNPGVTVVPVTLPYADEKAWTWSHWTWSPGTGLTSTTGTHDTIITTALPPIITYTIVGTDSATCQSRTMYLTVITCNNTRNNSPCYGDSLLLRRIGDSTGCTYFWYGPGGFTSTLQNPFIYPATYADSGEFYVVRTLLGVHDTDSTHVVIHYKPVVLLTNNSPLCQNMTDTLDLFLSPAIPGETFSWTGPAGFTSTLQDPTRPGFGFAPADTGTYTVYVTTSFGCKDTASIHAELIPQPSPPTVTDPTYCQGQPFVPFTVTGLVAGPPPGVAQWYTTPTGGTGTTTAPTVPTTIPGLYTYYFSQKAGSCESARDSIRVRVVTTPLPPTAAGTMQYCQFIGPFVPLTITPPDSVRWSLTPTGPGGLFVEPVPNLNIATAYNYYISRVDSGCESGRTPVTITVWPKPAKPVVDTEHYCQFRTAHQVSAHPSGTGDILTWYGPGITPPSPIAPTPNTSIAPSTDTFWVTETTIHNCISDSAIDTVPIRLKPAIPVTGSIKYCQGPNGHSAPLNLLVDSLNNSYLKWYYNAVQVFPSNPRPFTDTMPGTYTWYVSQTIPATFYGCESDSGAVNVTIIYKPVFSINVSSPWVCQFDSLRLSYNGPQLPPAPGYTWTLPAGSVPVSGTNIHDSMMVVQFDTASQNLFVKLHASDDSGFCASDDSIRIRVIPQPNTHAFTNPEVCLGDTVQLALGDRTAGAFIYQWYIDDLPMLTSSALNIISSNSNSGGPFTISWIDSGTHIIKVVTETEEGCKSYPTADSVKVHTLPDARFTYTTTLSRSLCIEDSVLFTAATDNYNYSYEWTPEHFFNNTNKASIWGKVELVKSIVTLKVTDPFGCYATTSQELDPGTCCTVAFPSAFTPNGIGPNNFFHPLFTGYHRFHMFRIANRWGQTIYESGNSANAAWDGNFNGVPQDMGVYYYYIKYDCGGQTMEQKGDVTLIR